MKKTIALISAPVVLALASCNTPLGNGVQPLSPHVNVEEIERQAPVTPTPNPTGQLYDATIFGSRSNRF